VKAGDAVVTVDPLTHRERAVTVHALTVHSVKNYAITRSVLVSAVAGGDREVVLSSRVLEATPNRPMGDGKTAGELKVGDRVWCVDGSGCRAFTVWDKTEAAGGEQRKDSWYQEKGVTSRQKSGIATPCKNRYWSSN